MNTRSSLDFSKSIKSIDFKDKTQYATFWFLDHVFGKENVDILFSKERQKAKDRLIRNVSKNGKKGSFSIPIKATRNFCLSPITTI